MPKIIPAPEDARNLLADAIDLAFDLQESARLEPSEGAEHLAYSNRIFDLQSAIFKGDFAAFDLLRTLLAGPLPTAFHKGGGYLAAQESADETLVEYGKAQQRAVAAARRARQDQR